MSVIKRNDIPPPAVKKGSPWDFREIKPGDSIHVKTHADRVNAMNAFRYWVWTSKKNQQRLHMQGAGAYAVSESVDEKDVDGPGFRIWFLTRPKAKKEEDI